MENYRQDIDQNLRVIFFLSLFSLFVLAFSINQGTHYSTSTRYSAHNELEIGNISIRHNAVICNYFILPDLQIFSQGDIPNTSLNPFSILHKLSDYNNRTGQRFIHNQKTRLTIEPLLLWRLYNSLSSSDTGDLPVLS